jgi:hypothetical protein
MEIFKHRNPVWRGRDDMVVRFPMPKDDPEDGDEFEECPATLVKAGIAEIACIPFYVYDVALADFVSFDENGNFVSVVIPSGRYAFRLLRDDLPDDEWREIFDHLESLGALWEAQSDIMRAIDCATILVADEVAAYLVELEQNGTAQFETVTTVYKVKPPA